MNEQKEKTVNQKIHEWLGKCWHSDHSECFGSECGGRTCKLCREWVGCDLNPAYDQDLNAVAEVEAKVIETFGRDEYFRFLESVCEGKALIEEQGVISWGDVAYTIATASASIRAAAIVSLIEEKR